MSIRDIQSNNPYTPINDIKIEQKWQKADEQPKLASSEKAQDRAITLSSNRPSVKSSDQGPSVGKLFLSSGTTNTAKLEKMSVLKSLGKAMGKIGEGLNIAKDQLTNRFDAKHALINELNIGDYQTLKTELASKDINNANNLKSSITSANTKIFGGCDREKAKGGLGDRTSQGDIETLNLDLAGQSQNLKLAIFKAVHTGQAKNAEPLKELSSNFKELSDMYKQLASKEGLSNLTNAQKQEFKNKLDTMKSSFRQIEPQLDKSPDKDLSELKMACISFEGTSGLLAKCLDKNLREDNATITDANLHKSLDSHISSFQKNGENVKTMLKTILEGYEKDEKITESLERNPELKEKFSQLKASIES